MVLMTPKAEEGKTVYDIRDYLVELGLRASSYKINKGDNNVNANLDAEQTRMAKEDGKDLGFLVGEDFPLEIDEY